MRVSVDYLDDSGKALFGKHKGKDIHVISAEDPSYLKWLVSNVDLTNEDAEIVSAILEWRRR